MNIKKYINSLWRNIDCKYTKDTSLVCIRDKNWKCSLSLLRRHVIIGERYIADELEKHGEEDGKQIVLHSIGHELTHKGDKYFYRTAFPVTKRYSVISKINEVHADYGGAVIAKLSKDDFVEVMEIKWGDMSDEESKTHPSHRQRIKYAKIGSFDNKLVQTICDDNGYKESKEFYGMYEDIRLE